MDNFTGITVSSEANNIPALAGMLLAFYGKVAPVYNRRLI